MTSDVEERCFGSQHNVQANVQAIAIRGSMPYQMQVWTNGGGIRGDRRNLSMEESQESKRKGPKLSNDRTQLGSVPLIGILLGVFLPIVTVIFHSECFYEQA